MSQQAWLVIMAGIGLAGIALLVAVNLPLILRWVVSLAQPVERTLAIAPSPPAIKSDAGDLAEQHGFKCLQDVSHVLLKNGIPKDVVKKTLDPIFAMLVDYNEPEPTK